MNKRLFHPEFLDSLETFFTRQCTVKEPDKDQSDSGEPVITWTDKYVGISCAIGKTSGEEVRGPSNTYHKATHRVILKGYYDDITGDMEVVVGNLRLNVLYTEPDHRSQKTSLVCEIIKQ